MAISISKNKAKAGISNVPNPNPEKKVSSDAKSAVTPIINSSILFAIIEK
jgi:hypothetical protein